MEWNERFQLFKKGAVLVNDGGVLRYTNVPYTRWCVQHADRVMWGRHYRDYDKAYSRLVQMGGKPRMMYQGKFLD